MADETFRVSGIEVRVDPQRRVWHGEELLGKVGREQRFGQWFWRGYDPQTGEPYKRFLTTRPEAILLLLLNSGHIDGIGF